MAHSEFIGPDGKVWPSVTKVGDVLAKPQLYAWYAKHGVDGAKKIKDDAGDIGIMFHDGIYHRFNGTSPSTPLTPQAQNMVNAFFNEFVTPYKVQVESMETKVVSNEYRTHGTYDAIVHVTNLPIGRARTKYTGRVLADWKQSNGIYDSHGLQLGGYWLCASNPPNDGLVVQVNRETLDIRKKLFNDLRWYAEEFKAARDLYDFVNHEGAWSRD